MYLRTVRVKKQDKVLEYVQLAHSHRDPLTRKPSVKILYNLGRADRLDMDALRRLVRSISRFLEPGLLLNSKRAQSATSDPWNKGFRSQNTGKTRKA